MTPIKKSQQNFKLNICRFTDTLPWKKFLYDGDEINK